MATKQSKLWIGKNKEIISTLILTLIECFVWMKVQLDFLHSLVVTFDKTSWNPVQMKDLLNRFTCTGIISNLHLHCEHCQWQIFTPFTLTPVKSWPDGSLKFVTFSSFSCRDEICQERNIYNFLAFPHFCIFHTYVKICRILRKLYYANPRDFKREMKGENSWFSWSLRSEEH